MNKETLKKMREFNVIVDENLVLSKRYKEFEIYLKQVVSGEGMIGDNNYLLLWEKSEIEELNNAYETKEFLKDIILIGSDGGDTAYGIDVAGRYIEVPFIGMDDEEVKIIAEDFDDFIDHIWKKE